MELIYPTQVNKKITTEGVHSSEQNQTSMAKAPNLLGYDPNTGDSVGHQQTDASTQTVLLVFQAYI